MSLRRDDRHSVELVGLVEKTKPAATQTGEAALKNGAKSLAGWWRTAKLWYLSKDRWQARGILLFATCLALVRILLLVKISYLVRQFDSTLADKDKDGFQKALWGWGVVIIIAAPLFALTDFVQERLKVEWRNWLTKEMLAAYYAKRAYYQIHQKNSEVDNPDQRICDDVPYFVHGSTDLMLGIARKVFGVIAFSGVLWRVAPNLVLFLFAYTAIGTFLTTSVFGKKLMQLTYTILQREGDLRFNLVRTRENSESIAFYGGDAQEAQTANQRLRVLIEYTRYKIAWMTGLSLWTNAYSYVTMLLPPILTAPRYFAGEIEFGVITQVGFAFRHIEGALNYLVDNLDKFSSLAAVSQRLDTLLQELSACSTVEASIIHTRQPKSGLILENFTVQTPSGNLKLCQGLDVILNEGNSLLIVGPSGCGKSSLLRAISGLWISGSGNVQTPPQAELFFLPQKPYMPQGTLRHQLLYPSGDSSTAEDKLRSRQLATISDAALLEVLDRVSLSGLAERVGGLSSDLEWAHTLSLGEQQRVAFARLLLHQPSLAFLDEATGALDTTTESILYNSLRGQSTSYVSIGHRQELCKFHSHVLEHVKDSTWRTLTMAEYQRQLA